MTGKFLKKTYGIEGTPAVRAHYNDWAASYDAEVAENGYATPARCAAALKASGLPPEAPILDMGCGTGLGGLALRAEGFTKLDGTDLSPGMLAEARARGIYRHLFPATEGAPDIPAGTYRAVSAIGVIGSGAAPASLLDTCLGLLDPGGYFVFSFNDHTLAMPEFTDHIARWKTAGAVRILVEEHGPHLPGLDMSSTVYLLEKN
ncbi:methyltransferase domain-containing protein [Boseongicola sp. H5]|uniref:class I SAM-dependent DNA methyltransferase n=1 Tax=Boseongicola sp. H5 TaxID=2763261 RepID=UPI001D0A96D2|nr:methyltransferase domain-containing protein [Boseongicola sp. H5]